MTFEWDSKKAKTNLEKHKIAFEEAATLFEDPQGLEIWIPSIQVLPKKDFSD